MVSYSVHLKQGFKDIKFSYGSKNKVLKDIGNTLDDMPQYERIMFEFIKI